MTHKSASAVTLLAALLAGCATLASLHACTGYAAQLEAINGQ
jgi:hypothetical protein